MVSNGDVCISSSLQHSDIGRIQGCCCETVSDGIYVSAHRMMCCRSVAIKHSIEGIILHFHVDGPAVLIGCLLMSLLLKSCIASLHQCWQRLEWPAVQHSQPASMLAALTLASCTAQPACIIAGNAYIGQQCNRASLQSLLLAMPEFCGLSHQLTRTRCRLFCGRGLNLMP